MKENLFLDKNIKIEKIKLKENNRENSYNKFMDWCSQKIISVFSYKVITDNKGT